MKLLFSFLLISYSFGCQAQDFAAVAVRTNEHSFYYSASSAASGRGHTQTTLGTVGTWTMLGGAVITVAGIIEAKGATKTDGPFTFVNESQLNAGHAAEILGGGIFTAGLTMIIIDAVNRHHGGSKVSIVAPKRNEMGVAYNF